MSERSVFLLGDSILDNEPYTAPEPATATHLSSMLGDGWSVTLLARDGATMADIPRQAALMADRDGTAVLSVGGNDLAQHIDLLARSSTSAPALLGELLHIADRFASRYADVAHLVAGRVQRTILCTIYEVQLEPPEFAQLVRVPLGSLNDRIIRTAVRLGLEVLELRDVCVESSDFVMQIEPSAVGARKIASAIAAVLRGDSTLPIARIHGAR